MLTTPPTADILRDVQAALDEDLGGLPAEQGDITAQLIPAGQQITAHIITREPCVLAGTAWAEATFAELSSAITIDWQAQDGDQLTANDTLCTLQGPARALLTGERTALNFLQTLSATATHTAQCVAALGNSNTRLLDTRKTLPGLRLAQKYAVTCGGGKNHRIGLFDAFLIKENHILACGGIAQAVAAAKAMQKNVQVEVEVENLDELQQALDAKADIVMLDNFTLDTLKKAVVINAGRARLEVSGNIELPRLTALASIGVDYISSGALTKHIRAIDLSFRVSG